MWRALFMAIGISGALFGLECLAIDKAILIQKSNGTGSTLTSSKEWVPPEWAPWSLITGGVIVVLYSFTIPRRVAG